MFESDVWWMLIKMLTFLFNVFGTNTWTLIGEGHLTDRVNPQCYDLIEILQTCEKNQFHHLIPYAFEFLQSASWSSSDIIISIVKHQGFETWGKSAWVNERSQAVCQSDPREKIFMPFNSLACILVWVCVCVYGRREQMQGFDLIKEEKLHLYMHIDILMRVLMWFSMHACHWLSLKSEENRLMFPYLCFIQQDAPIHTLSRLKPRAFEFVSLIYHWKSTCTLQSNNVTIHRRLTNAFWRSGLDLFTHRSHMAGEAVTCSNTAGRIGDICVQEVRHSSR